MCTCSLSYTSTLSFIHLQRPGKRRRSSSSSTRSVATAQEAGSKSTENSHAGTRSSSRRTTRSSSGQSNSNSTPVQAAETTREQSQDTALIPAAGSTDLVDPDELSQDEIDQLSRAPKAQYVNFAALLKNFNETKSWSLSSSSVNSFAGTTLSKVRNFVSRTLSRALTECASLMKSEEAWSERPSKHEWLTWGRLQVLINAGYPLEGRRNARNLEKAMAILESRERTGSWELSSQSQSQLNNFRIDTLMPTHEAIQSAGGVRTSRTEWLSNEIIERYDALDYRWVRGREARQEVSETNYIVAATRFREVHGHTNLACSILVDDGLRALIQSETSLALWRTQSQRSI